MKLIKIFMIVLASVTSACATAEKGSPTVTIADLEGNEIARIADNKIVSVFLENLDQKVEVIFKKRPDFELKLSIDDRKPSEWLYSSMGVVTSVDKKNGIYYRVNLPSINQFLQK